jgi:hypothetical protein
MMKITQIHGAWLAEQESKASGPVAKALLATGKARKRRDSRYDPAGEGDAPRLGGFLNH